MVEEFWSNHIINMNSDISYDEYQGMLLYSDYINLDIKNSTFEDLTLSIGIKEINDKNIRLVWNRKLWYILGLDYNSHFLGIMKQFGIVLNQTMTIKFSCMIVMNVILSIRNGSEE